MATAEKQSAFVWDCSTAEYDSDTLRVRATGLEDFHESSKLYRDLYVTKTMVRQVTKALRIGIMSHCVLFETDRWQREYAKAPKFDGRKKVDIEAKTQWYADHPGVTIVDDEEYATVCRIATAVRASKEAMRYIDADGPQEQAIAWQDTETMLECKSRRDKIATFRRRRVIICLKTAIDVSESGFASAVGRFGYHRKAAFYQNGEIEVSGERIPFVWIAAQNREPWEVCVYEAHEDFLVMGRRDVRRDLNALATCIETDNWESNRERQTSVLPPPRWLAYESEWRAQ